MKRRAELTTKAWASMRLLVLERDNYTCWKCGKKLRKGDRATQVDHLVPPMFGGSDDPSNLAASCGPCNNRKNHYWSDMPVLTIQW